MEEIIAISDAIAKLLRDAAQIGLAIVAIVLCVLGRAFRFVYQTPHEGRKRLAGFAFWWKLVEPDIGSKKSSELTIVGILWNSGGGGSFHIGKHVFNVMPGMPQEHGRLSCKIGIFYNRPKDLTAIRRKKQGQ